MYITLLFPGDNFSDTASLIYKTAYYSSKFIFVFLHSEVERSTLKLYFNKVLE